MASSVGQKTDQHDYGGIQRNMASTRSGARWGRATSISLGHRRDHRHGNLRAHGNRHGKPRGPAIILSFILAAIACVFAGLCYAEFASMIPVAGSAYTYGYATLGELVAWIIGWDLILEYALGAATVASGWSGYVLSFLQDFGIHLSPGSPVHPGTVFVEYPRARVTGRGSPRNSKKCLAAGPR